MKYGVSRMGGNVKRREKNTFRSKRRRRRVRS